VITVREWDRRISRGQSVRVLFTVTAGAAIMALTAILDGAVLPPPASIQTTDADLIGVAGLYVFPSAVPGTYTLTVTARSTAGCEGTTKPLGITVR
jgi:hypothetical protein